MTAKPTEFGELFILDAAARLEPALDLGCAFGVVALAALKAGARVIANDIDSRHLKEVKAGAAPGERARLELRLGRFPQEINFDDASIGAVHAANLLNFLKGSEIEQGMRAAARWLIPGGRFYIVAATPFAGNIQLVIPTFEERCVRGEAWPGEVANIQSFSTHPTVRELPPFLHLLTPDVLERAARHAGLEVIRSELYARRGLPEYLRLDGRENLGMVLQRPHLD
jgi:SAM-dependent methyltransferase